MKRFILSLVLAMTAVSLYAGNVLEVKGNAEALIDGKWTPIKKGMAIVDGTKIMTGVSSSVKIQTVGGFFEVKELTQAAFTEKVDSKTANHDVSLEVGRVRVRFVKPQGVQSSFRVTTPKGTASVRGTEEEVSYRPGFGMEITVFEGSIDVLNNAGLGFISYQGQDSGVNGLGRLFDPSDGQGDTFGYIRSIDSPEDLTGTAIDDFFNNPDGNEPERL